MGVEGAAPTQFNHGLYIQWNNKRTTLLRNIISRSALTGAQLRSEGIRAQNNLLVHNPECLNMGFQRGDAGGKEPGDAPARGLSQVVTDNICLYGIDRSNGKHGFMYGGRGIQVANLKSGLLERNIIAYSTAKLGGGIAIFQDEISGIKQLRVANNLIYRWNYGLSFWGKGKSENRIDLVANRVDTNPKYVLVQHNHSGIHGRARYLGNKYFSENEKPFSVGGRSLFAGDFRLASNDPDFTRAKSWRPKNTTIEEYLERVGKERGLVNFYSQIRAQERGRWDPRFGAGRINAFLRAGFGW